MGTVWGSTFSKRKKSALGKANCAHWDGFKLGVKGDKEDSEPSPGGRHKNISGTGCWQGP